MTQDQHDEQCQRWGHRERKVVWCTNPTCPGRPAAELVELDEVPDVTDSLQREPEVPQHPPKSS